MSEKRSIINLSSCVELRANPQTKDEARAFSINAYTGKVLDSFWSQFIIDLSGIKTKPKTPILRNHDDGRIVGWADGKAVDDTGLNLSGKFSRATADAKEVLDLAEEGFPWQASVGIQPLQVRVLGKNETMDVNGQTVSGPDMEVWTQSFVGEVSIVPWGRDNDTSVAMLSKGGDVTVDIIQPENQETEDMKDTMELKEKYPDLYREVFELGAASVDIDAAKTDGAAAERDRVTAILSEKADLSATEQAIKEGLSVEGSYKLFYEAEKAKKALSLQELAASADNAIGHTAPKDPEPEIKDPSAEVSMKAQAMAVEKKINLADATRMVLAENPKLAASYYNQFNA